MHRLKYIVIALLVLAICGVVVIYSLSKKGIFLLEDDMQNIDSTVLEGQEMEVVDNNSPSELVELDINQSFILCNDYVTYLDDKSVVYKYVNGDEKQYDVDSTTVVLGCEYYVELSGKYEESLQPQGGEVLGIAPTLSYFSQVNVYKTGNLVEQFSNQKVSSVGVLGEKLFLFTENFVQNPSDKQYTLKIYDLQNKKWLYDSAWEYGNMVSLQYDDDFYVFENNNPMLMATTYVTDDSWQLLDKSDDMSNSYVVMDKKIIPVYFNDDNSCTVSEEKIEDCCNISQNNDILWIMSCENNDELVNNVEEIGINGWSKAYRIKSYITSDNIIGFTCRYNLCAIVAINDVVIVDTKIAGGE